MRENVLKIWGGVLLIVLLFNAFCITSYAATTLYLERDGNKLVANFESEGKVISWRWGKETMHNGVSYNERLSQTNELDITNLTGQNVTLTITYGVDANDKYGSRVDRRTYRQNIKVSSGARVSNIYSSVVDYKDELDRLLSISNPSSSQLARISQLKGLIKKLESGNSDVLKVNVYDVPGLTFYECRWYMREPDGEWGAVTGISSTERIIDTSKKGRQYMFKLLDGSDEKRWMAQSDIYTVK